VPAAALHDGLSRTARDHHRRPNTCTLAASARPCPSGGQPTTTHKSPAAGPQTLEPKEPTD